MLLKAIKEMKRGALEWQQQWCTEIHFSLNFKTKISAPLRAVMCVFSSYVTAVALLQKHFLFNFQTTFFMSKVHDGEVFNGKTTPAICIRRL